MKVLIIGAGPAGLTAAFELLKKNPACSVYVYEESNRIGGIACTINHNGYRMDIGSHRFFSKSDRVMDWWFERMPLQSKPAKNDSHLNAHKEFSKNGVDPETNDRVMLIIQRITRIFYMRKFFDYPISIKLQTFINLGFINTIKAGFGYIWSQINKRANEDSLEDFLINRFGTPLYSMFFEKYTEKVWGIHPKYISSAWGAQRIKGISLMSVVKTAISSPFRKKSSDLRQKDVETSLIEQFFYPKLGVGHMWECVADDVTKMGGNILLNHSVKNFSVENNKIVSVTSEFENQTKQENFD